MTIFVHNRPLFLCFAIFFAFLDSAHSQTPGLPLHMKFCGPARCFVLTLKDGHYDAVPFDNPDEGVYSTYTVVRWTLGSIILNRKDREGATATLTGRMVNGAGEYGQGWGIQDGTITIHRPDGSDAGFPYTLTWTASEPTEAWPGPSPATPSTAPQAKPLTASESKKAPAKQGNVEVLQYPGTNFPTQFTAINNKGVAVGFFTHPLSGAVCDPNAFGGPCPSGDQMGDALRMPYAFVYEDGKFTRFKGKLVEVPNNLPLGINDAGEVVVLHGRLQNLPSQSGFQFLLYNVATGAVKQIPSGDLAGRSALGNGGISAVLLLKIAGMNDAGEIAAKAEIKRIAAGGANVPTGDEYGLVIGKLGLSKNNDKSESETRGKFEQINVELPRCRKEPSGTQYTNEEFGLAGPNDKGQVGISCGHDVAIYGLGNGLSSPVPVPEEMPPIDVKGINNSGSLVGCSDNGTDKKAFSYASGRFSELALPNGNSCAMGINEQGEIVGYVGDSAFIIKP
jgi:hypothetical protein